MTVSQISVFANSRPGHMSRVLALFEEAGVSVRGFSAADTGEYGILRFVVDRPEDTPGELLRVIGVLARCGINVVYCYSMISTYIVLSVTDTEQARDLLAAEPVEMISQDDIARYIAERDGKEA